MDTASKSPRARWRALCLGTVLALSGWSGAHGGASGSAPDAYSKADFAAVRKFDSHVHLNAFSPEVLDQVRRDNFEVLSINVDYPDFPSLAVQEGAGLEYAAADRDHVHLATTFSMTGWGQPGWASDVSSQLDRAVARGAVAVKVWKNIGMSVRNAHGDLVMLDDPGLDPVFAHIRDLGVPLIVHAGEPRNCWLPLEQMTVEGDRSYFREHPQYHMYLQPRMPGYEDQLAARDRRLTRTPGLTFVGAHLASLEWSVDRLAAFLDAHPGAAVDMAARMAHLQHQSHRAYGKVRDFLIHYQDRIVYGSDLTFEPGGDAAAFRKEAHDAWMSDWIYLATAETQRIEDIDADVRGLQLPRGVIDKIYRKNARRTFFARAAATGSRDPALRR